MKLLSCVRNFATLWTMAYRLLRPWHFPGKGTGMGCHFLIQEIFPTGSRLSIYLPIYVSIYLSYSRGENIKSLHVE